MVDGAGELALRRDGQVYERTLGDDTSTAPPWDLSSGTLDNVVITGGWGAIGLSFARFLAARGARRIVLLSRRGAGPAPLDNLGAEIIAPACDLLWRPADPFGRTGWFAWTFSGAGDSVPVCGVGACPGR